jgi:hypothetical protein
MKFEKIQCTLGSHFVAALEYGDETGLSDEESAELQAFVESLPKGKDGNNHWSWGESEEFARCEVGGMMGECVSAEYLFVPEVKPSKGMGM